MLLETEFLRSLDAHNFFSGYAEMLKHGLISTPEHLAELLAFDTEKIDYALLKSMVGRSVQVKEHIVEEDPQEHGIRKALNLGHTVGHAFESLALAENRPVLHGYAVAWGLVCELYLSYIKTGFPKDKMRQTIQFVKENYGSFSFNCKQYDQLYELMKHDKKNTAGVINFTLLKKWVTSCSTRRQTRILSSRCSTFIGSAWEHSTPGKERQYSLNSSTFIAHSSPEKSSVSFSIPTGSSLPEFPSFPRPAPFAAFPAATYREGNIG